MKLPVIRKENVKPLLETGFLNVYDLQYEEGKHYYNATRRKLEDLASIKDEEEYKAMVPDAVSCVVILVTPDGDERLLLAYEYRYPAGRLLLGVPAGLIDPRDKEEENPVLSAAAREICEETGIVIGDRDTLKVISPDESNALALVVIRLEDLSVLSQEGAEGQELFAGFELLTMEEAGKILAEGRDKYGNFYSMYTWAALMYFVNRMWKE